MKLKFIKYMESWLYSTTVIPTLNTTQENLKAKYDVSDSSLQWKNGIR